MDITSEETQAKITAEDLAEIFGVGEMTDEQRKAVEKALAGGSGGGERTTKDRAARPMDTQRAARLALDKEKDFAARRESVSGPSPRDRTGGNPAGGSRVADPRR